MPAFDTWDVIKVPFPYTNRPVLQRRPALVVAAIEHEGVPSLLWALMITSSENRGWPGDVAISNLVVSGLPAPSIVRTMKIATLDASDAVRIGQLPPADQLSVAHRLRATLRTLLAC